MKAKWEELLEENGEKQFSIRESHRFHGGYSFFYATNPTQLDELAK